MKAIMITVRLWWFYLTYKGIKKAEIRKRFAKDFKGKIYEYVSKTNWKKDLMKIPEEERELFKQFVGKVGLCFECDKVESFEFCEFSKHKDNLELYNECVRKDNELCKKACISCVQMVQYLDTKAIGKDMFGKAIHITEAKPFDKPKEISDFHWYRKQWVYCGMDCPPYVDEVKYNLTRAPESWCYVEV